MVGTDLSLPMVRRARRQSRRYGVEAAWGVTFDANVVYFNDGDRFRGATCLRLPTVGTHYMHRADVGNQYDRSYRQTYVSSIYSLDRPRKKGRLPTSSSRTRPLRCSHTIQ